MAAAPLSKARFSGGGSVPVRSGGGGPLLTHPSSLFDTNGYAEWLLVRIVAGGGKPRLESEYGECGLGFGGESDSGEISPSPGANFPTSDLMSLASTSVVCA
jgi:hypothetical protein